MIFHLTVRYVWFRIQDHRTMMKPHDWISYLFVSHILNAILFIYEHTILFIFICPLHLSQHSMSKNQKSYFNNYTSAIIDSGAAFWTSFGHDSKGSEELCFRILLGWVRHVIEMMATTIKIKATARKPPPTPQRIVGG